MNWQVEADYWEKKYHELLELIEMVSHIIGNQEINRSEYHKQLQRFRELIQEHLKKTKEIPI